MIPSQVLISSACHCFFTPLFHFGASTVYTVAMGYDPLKCSCQISLLILQLWFPATHYQHRVISVSLNFILYEGGIVVTVVLYITNGNTYYQWYYY